jgi:hypothetical protein
LNRFVRFDTREFHPRAANLQEHQRDDPRNSADD